MSGSRGDKQEIRPSVATSRPQADTEWLARLRRDGLTTLLPDPPSIPGGVAKAVQQINQGHYWQAHETLEEVWLHAPYPVRLFYYALIKTAVGLLHLERGNKGGARQQLQAAVDFLEPFSPRFQGLRTDLLLEDAKSRLEATSAGTGRIDDPLRIRWEAGTSDGGSSPE